VTLQFVTQAEICGDGIDNDCNGKTDCEDVICEPAFFSITMTGLTCPPESQLGKIIIIPSDSKTYRYSIDDKKTWQSSPVFSNANVDVYSIWIEDVTTGCTRAYFGNPMLISPALCPPTDGRDEDKVICEDECVTIGTEPTATYCYKWESAEGLDDKDLTLPNPRVCPTRTTTYKLQITDDQGNKQGTDEVTVVVQPKPTVTITPTNAKVCNGTPIILNAGAGFTTYSWSNNATTQTIQVQTAGTYSVTVTNRLGCQASASIDVQGSNVSVSITPSQATICVEPVALQATPGFIGYTWKDQSGEEIEFTSTLSVEEPGTYTVEVQDELGCTATASVTVNKAVSDIMVTPNPAYLCLGGTVTITAPTGYSTYEWKNAGGAIVSTTRTFEADRTGSYTLTATNATGCKASTMVKVDDSKASSLEITPPDPSICMTEEPPGLTTSKQKLEKRLSSGCEANNAFLNAGDGFTNYIWSTGSVAPAIIVGTTGTYSVTVTDVNGCQASQSIEVKSCAEPGLEITPDPALLCEGEPLTLDAGVGFQTYEWSKDGATVATTQTLDVTEPGEYKVIATDAGGCMAVDKVTVEVAADSAEVDLEIYKPSVITGNTTTLVANEDNIGGMTFVNLDNDDRSPGYDIDETSMTSADDEFMRIRLKLSINDSTASRKVTLSAITGANSIIVWQSADKKMGKFSLGSQIELTQQDGAYYIKDLWVEGILPHTMQRETKLLLLYNTNPNCPIVGDTVGLTIVGVDKLEWQGINNNLMSNGTDYRVFPDAANPGGNARQEIDLKVTLSVAPVEDLDIYLKAFDVDDPENKDKQFIDPNDKKNVQGMQPYEGNAGLTYDENNDNRGLPKEGHLQQVSLIFPANNAVDTIQFQQLSLHPGDNYQIVANGDRDFLNDLRNKDADDGADIINIHTKKIVKEPTHYLSPVLTVWRTLHLEHDSMMDFMWSENEVQDTFTDFDGGNNLGSRIKAIKGILKDLESAPTGNGRFENGSLIIGNTININQVKSNTKREVKFPTSSIIGLSYELKDTLNTDTINGNIIEVEKISGDRYKWTLKIVPATTKFDTSFINGRLSVAGGHGVKVLAVDTTKVKIVDTVLVKIITDSLFIPFKLRDDDQPPGTLPIIPLDLSVLMGEYEKSYLHVDFPYTGGAWMNENTIDFEANVPDLIRYGRLIAGRRQSGLRESNVFWVVHITTCWQSAEDRDYDPKTEEHTGITRGFTDGPASHVDVATGGTTSAIFIEVINDKNSMCRTIARNVAHEIGHQFGLDHGYDTPTSKPIIPEFPKVGLMHYNACDSLNTKGDALIERHINLIRSRIQSPGGIR